MKQPLAFLFSLILAPLSFGQNVGEAIESPDMKRFLQSHTLDLKKDFGGWVTETSECKIKYGDWSCILRNKVLWCDGYWDKITIKSNPFELVNKTGEVSSVVLKSQKRDPRIPLETPVSRIHQLSMKKSPLTWMLILRDVPLVRFYPLGNPVKQ